MLRIDNKNIILRLVKSENAEELYHLIEKIYILCAQKNSRSNGIPARLNFKEVKVEECSSDNNIRYLRTTYVMDALTWRSTKNEILKGDKNNIPKLRFSLTEKEKCCNK